VRTIAVVTTSMADYGVYLPVLRRIQSDPALRLALVVSGSHLMPSHGLSVTKIEADGFAVAERVDAPPSADTPEATATAMGTGLQGFGRAFARLAPNIAVVLGDRYEMSVAALAALPFRIPVAHIHGGELTVGAFDDALRHSVTKLSHLHFVSTDEYARRVRQMGEEPWRVTVSGAPSLDNLRAVRLQPREALETRLGLRLGPRFLLATFHPATLERADPREQACALLDAIVATGLPCVITLPNADPGGMAIRSVINQLAADHPQLQPVESVGTEAYFSLMALAAAMAGNSSSGLIEAASFELPVLNVGSRQAGRVRARNVIDVEPDAGAIAAGLRRALDPDFRAALRGLVNPYGDGHAADRIVERLATVELGAGLVTKWFVDLPVGEA
jgi:UDP-hydrolysing UDP-N-acetyl-D-glucosamine 2-epimerase